MYPRYLLEVHFRDLDAAVFSKRFKSINNAVKVAVGFHNECLIFLTDTVFDREIDIDELMLEFIESV